MKFKPFARQGRHVSLDEFTITDIMPNLKPAKAWHVLCFIAFKTEGHDKPDDEISYSQIMAGTGIRSSATLSKCLKELKEKEYILEVDSDKRDEWDTCRYRLNVDYEVELPPDSSALKNEAETPPALKNEASVALKNEAETPPALKNEASVALKNEDTVVVINDVVDGNDSFTSSYRLYTSGCGDMTQGQAQIFGDYFDDPDCPNEWITVAVKQTVSHNPTSPFPYFMKTINSIIAAGGPTNGGGKGRKNATRSNHHGRSDTKLAGERAALEEEIRRLEGSSQK